MLKVKPYDYQAAGIDFGLSAQRLLIADEPGLGKTLQSIGVIDKAGAYPCLVICPSSLKINWVREWEKFTDKRAAVLCDALQVSWPYLVGMGAYQTVVCNYESLRKYFVVKAEKRRGPKCPFRPGAKGQPKEPPFRLSDVVFDESIKIFRSVIIDESHRVKDASAQQTIFAKGIASGKKWIILLSGTPIVNQPADLITQLSIMDRLKDFGGKRAFEAAYCQDGSDLSDLSARLYGTCLIRREKSQVLPELPAKTRVDLYVDIDNREEYDTAESDLAVWLRDYKQCSDAEVRRKMRMEVLVRFMSLRALSSHGKVKAASDFIDTFLASGKKLIVFCSLHDIVDKLLLRFPGAAVITGRQSAGQKQEAVDAFQTDPKCRLVLCSIKAAGVGLTLTTASDVCFVEFPWTYADCCQCEDRAHRIGQKDNVTCYYLIGRNTIDGALYSIIHKKKSIANTIMAASDDIPTERAYIEELLNSMFD